MRCDSCNKKLIKTERRTDLAERDDDCTEGQMADYFAAELSGEYGSWGIGVVEYFCPSCRRVYQIITDELKNYDPMILRWHERAKDGDYFSRFVFEYLAFSALLKNKLFIGVASDRAAIQHLKQDTVREEAYVAAIAAREPLLRLWQDVMVELERIPLHNSSRDLDNPEIDVWWNCTGFDPRNGDKSPQGVVRSRSDWGNMVEFWHGVRNNLFHGGKDPSIRRDCFLVEHAYLTLTSFMETEINHLTI
jgi:phage FluMu protein Com